MRRIEYKKFDLEETVKGVYSIALNGSARLVSFNIGEGHDMKGTPVLWEYYDLKMAKERVDAMYRAFESDYYDVY